MSGLSPRSTRERHPDLRTGRRHGERALRPAAEAVPEGIDPRVPSIARVYDCLLGGKDNCAADRDFADELLNRYPLAEVLARANRHFLGRAIRFLVDEAGINQFVDVGAGLPTVDNTHQVAQRVSDGARVVYVDNDPMVLAHGRALLAEQNRTAVITADMRNPATIIDHFDTQRLIDFSRPVGVIFASVLHFVPDHEPAQIVGHWWEAMASDSYLVISHAQDRPEMWRAAELYRDRIGVGFPRSRAQIAALFSGFDLVEPGLVPLPLWRPETSETALMPVGAEEMPMPPGSADAPAGQTTVANPK